MIRIERYQTGLSTNEWLWNLEWEKSHIEDESETTGGREQKKRKPAKEKEEKRGGTDK
jgi:hypothetical protein